MEEINMSVEKKQGLYFGWWPVVTGFLLMALIYAPGTSLIGLFIGPMATTFEVSTTASTTFVTLSLLSSVIGSGLSGKINTKFGARRVVSVMLIVMVLSYLGMAVAPSIYIAYLFSAIRGFGITFVCMIPISMLVTNWFGVKIRGKALAVASVGSGIGAMVLSPIIAGMIEGYGWRTTYVMFAVFSAVCVPLVLATFSPSPQAKGLTRLGDDPNDAVAAASSDGALTGLTGGQAMKTAMFWAVIIACICMGVGTQTWINLAPPFYGSLGMAAMTVGVLVSITALALTVAKLLLGAVCDRFGVKVGIVISMGAILLCYAFGVLAGINAAIAVLLAYVCSALMGIGQSVLNIVLPLVTNDLFGRKDYGTIFGYFNVAVYLGAGTGPLLAARFIDITGAYTLSFSVTFGFVAVTTILLMASYGLRKSAYAKNEPLQAANNR
jgi:MFS family permease